MRGSCQFLAKECAQILGPVVQSVVSLTILLRVISLTVLSDRFNTQYSGIFC